MPDNRTRLGGRYRPGSRACRGGQSLNAPGSDMHAVIDMFEEIRLVEYHQRLQTGVRADCTARAIFSLPPRATECRRSDGMPERWRREHWRISFPSASILPGWRE